MTVTDTLKTRVIATMMTTQYILVQQKPVIPKMTTVTVQLMKESQLHITEMKTGMDSVILKILHRLVRSHPVMYQKIQTVMTAGHLFILEQRKYILMAWITIVIILLMNDLRIWEMGLFAYLWLMGPHQRPME